MLIRSQTSACLYVGCSLRRRAETWWRGRNERRRRGEWIRDYGEKRGREEIRQGSRPMNKMHKEHSKFLMLFSFHREARFASSSPDYDIFSQHSRQGFAYFNVNASVCANQYQLVTISACAYTHTHTFSGGYCWEKLIGLKPFPLCFLSESILFPLYLFLSRTSSGIYYQMRSQACHFKLERTKKWADLLETQETERLWRGHHRNEWLFETVLTSKTKTLVTCSYGLTTHIYIILQVTSCCSAKNGYIYRHTRIPVLSLSMVLMKFRICRLT